MASNGGNVMVRILQKLQNRLQSGEYYEAHQIYRTLYFRYCAQQKLVEAIDLLRNGALALLQANQSSSGADLALLMLNAMETSNIPVNTDNIAKVVNLHRHMESDLVDRPSYVLTAVRWSRQNPTASASVSSVSSSNASSAISSRSSPVSSSTSKTVGHPHLHRGFAVTYWNECDYCQARYHFIRSEDGEGCAEMLIEYHIRCGYPSEVDMFVAQAVFQYLCLRNKVTAVKCFNRYTTCHPQLEQGPPFVRPLLNFIWLLLLAVDGGSLSIFSILCDQYQTSLKKDPSYFDYLAKIGQQFFHLAPLTFFGGTSYTGSLASDDGWDGEQSHFSEPCPLELD